MRKIIKLILISFLTFNLSLTSFASNAQQGNETDDQKLGTKIFPAESVPVKKTEEAPKQAQKEALKEADKKEDSKPGPNQPDSGKKEESAPQKPAEPKNEENTNKDKKEIVAETREAPVDKKPDPDMERLEKAVDDLVVKLDKNSNLTKALAEIQSTMNAEKKVSVTSKDVSQQTEAVLKDYNKKIQTASTEKERKQIENETARKIQSISRIQQPSSDYDSLEEDLDTNIPEKKKKILLEVKPDKVDENEDKNQILALNPTSEVEEEEVFFLENPIVIITSIFIIALVVAIGIVIRNNERKEKRKSNK